VGIDSDTHVMVGEARGARNAKMIGGGAALGALIGILSDRNNKNDHALAGPPSVPPPEPPWPPAPLTPSSGFPPPSP
jgi:hypothetical protein